MWCMSVFSFHSPGLLLLLLEVPTHLKISLQFIPVLFLPGENILKWKLLNEGVFDIKMQTMTGQEVNIVGVYLSYLSFAWSH